MVQPQYSRTIVLASMLDCRLGDHGLDIDLIAQQSGIENKNFTWAFRSNQA